MEQNTAPTFNSTIAKVAGNTGIAPDPIVETPTVAIVREAPKLPLAAAVDIPDGGSEAAVVTTLETPVAAESVVTEPSGEITIDNGDVVLASQRNADGTYKTKLDPTEKVDLVIKSIVDPETGKPKVYSKSLPELARLAKDGITMNQTVQKVTSELQAVQPEVEYYRTNVPKWQEHTQSLEQRLADQIALNQELLTAEDEIVIQHRERYKSDMSPEKQLERMKAEREQEQLTAKQQHQARIARSFHESRIAPALQKATDAGLDDYTVRGIVSALTDDLTVQGVIPPAKWPEMERRINDPNGPLAKAIATRSAQQSQESADVKAAREAAEAAQRQAQSVVNAVGRQMVPVGSAGRDSAPAPTKPKNSQEAIRNMINRPLPATV